MKILDLKQNTQEWKEYRRTAKNASDLPILFGDGYISRKRFIEMRISEEEPTYSEYVLNLFERGHQAEKNAIIYAEEIIKRSLFPVTVQSPFPDECKYDKDQYLSASFDGLTLDRKLFWEHKLYNEKKAKRVNDEQLPLAPDFYQIAQQFIVSGAKQCLYMLSDGTREGMVYMLINREQILNGCLEDVIYEKWQELDDEIKKLKE